MQEIREIVRLTSDLDVEIRKQALIELGRRFSERVSEVTGNEVFIFSYFVDLERRSISCTFYSNGRFPVDIYEGVASLRLDDSMKIHASCDLLAFWKNKRVVIDRGEVYKDMTDETYIYINFDSEGDEVKIKDLAWIYDSYHEWRSHTSPRRELYTEVEYIFD